jgi:hypothetical protein
MGCSSHSTLGSGSATMASNVGLVECRAKRRTASTFCCDIARAVSASHQACASYNGCPRSVLLRGVLALMKRRSVPAFTPMPDQDAQEALSALSNPQLLARLDDVLLELEKRLLRYAQVGPELLQMADEGLVLTVRARARLGQALSATQHAEGHLQVLAVGDWRPRSTRPSWHDDPRVTEETDH